MDRLKTYQVKSLLILIGMFLCIGVFGKSAWIFEEDSFVPVAKLQNGERFSIFTDHLGTPVMAVDSEGKKVWSRELDIYGKTRTETGQSNFIPFLYQGQYFDEEICLAYNRFRYYDSDSGTYISQDPIGLAGNNPNIYAYVSDVNSWVDVFGLSGRGWLNWAKKWHDKRADEIFGPGKGKSVGGRNYDKSYDGKDIEFKSDNFSKGPRSKESLARMDRQIDKDIVNKKAGLANPHWHFDHDPSDVVEMKDLLKKMDENGITRTHGKTYTGTH